MQILSGNQIYVAPHLRDEFETLRRDLLRDVQPVNALQAELFNSALRASWELRRCDQAELQLAAELGCDPLLSPDQRLARIQRTRAQAQRELRLALKELRRLQTDQAVRMLKENQGLRPLPVPIDASALIAAARAAGGYKKNERIVFGQQQAALDQVARSQGWGGNAWEAWQNNPRPQAPQSAAAALRPGRRAPEAPGAA